MIRLLRPPTFAHQIIRRIDEVPPGQGRDALLVEAFETDRWYQARVARRMYRLRRLAALALGLLLLASAPAEAGGWQWTRLTWYGHPYFGRRTACGQRYTRWVVGVATSLPLRCGTLVALRYRGRLVVAPVIDRMPVNDLGVVLDASAHVACELLNGRHEQGRCYSRDAEYRVLR